jgi:hypothetical protein
MALCIKTGTKQGARHQRSAKLCRAAARGLRRRVHGRESCCPTPVSRFRFRRPAISNRQFLVRLETSVTSSKHTAEHISNRHFWEGSWPYSWCIMRLRRSTVSRAGISSGLCGNRRAADANPPSLRSDCRRALGRSSGVPRFRYWN